MQNNQQIKTTLKKCKAVIVIMLACLMQGRSQDMLVGMNGDSLHGKILSYGAKELLFQIPDSGKTEMHVSRDTLLRIHFINGDIELYGYEDREMKTLSDSLSLEELESLGRAHAAEEEVKLGRMVKAGSDNVLLKAADLVGFQYTARSMGPKLNQQHYRTAYKRKHKRDRSLKATGAVVGGVLLVGTVVALISSIELELDLFDCLFD